MRNLKRRKFLNLAPVFLGGVALVSPICRAALGAARPNDPVDALLTRLVPENAMTLRVAGVVAALPDARNDAEMLRHGIAAVFQKDDVKTDGTARAFLDWRIRLDFDEGRTMKVDGWHLSRTEMGLMFLASEYRSR